MSVHTVAAVENESDVRLEQFNEATSFLDCSQVYGSTKSRQMALRLHTDGLLATNNNMKDFLPTRQQLSRYSQGAGSDFESKDFQSEVKNCFRRL